MLKVFTDSDARAAELRKSFEEHLEDQSCTTDLYIARHPAISDDGEGDVCLELFTWEGVFAAYFNRDQVEYIHRVFDQIRERGFKPMAPEEELLRRVWNKELSLWRHTSLYALDELMAHAIMDGLPPAEAASVLEYWRIKKAEAVDKVVQRVKAEAS